MSKLNPALFLAVSTTFCGTVLLAQTVDPGSSRSTASKHEVIELSPFVVTSEKDQGYQASNTLAGSRMNTSLRDTAASVSVLTAELMQDVGAINLNEAIAFAVNVEADDTQLSDDNATFQFFNTYRVRGQAATVARNYFTWKLPTNSFNIERIEEARGPNSILFGIASAGGLLSSQTKQASTEMKLRRAQIIYGSHDMRNMTADINQASDNQKFGVRLNLLWHDSQGYQHYVFNQDKRAHLAVKYNLSPSTTISGEYERGNTFSNKAKNNEIVDSLLAWYQGGRPLVALTGTATGLARNGTAGSLSVNLVDDGTGKSKNYDTRGQAITLPATDGIIVNEPTLVDNKNFTANIGGPGQTQASEFDTYSAFIDHKFWKNIYIQGAYNHQDYYFSAWQAQYTSGLRGDPNQFLRDGSSNPNAGRLYFENYWSNYQRTETMDNFRASASAEFNFGKWGEYRLAGLAEREERSWTKDTRNESWFDEKTQAGAFNTIPSASVNRVVHRHYITPGDYASYYGTSNNLGTIGLASGLVDPSNPSRTLGTRMVHSSTSDFNDLQEQDSYLFAAQAYYFRRKLVLAGGYRADTLYLHSSVRGVRDPVTQDVIVDPVANPRTNRTINGHTETVGGVYHMLPWLSLRYNKSNSLELANVAVRLMPRPDVDGNFYGSRVGDNPQGQGEDYGLDLNLMGGKIFLRATKFNTTRAGAQGSNYGGNVDNPSVMAGRILTALEKNNVITQAEFDKHRIDSGGSEFDVASTGYEYSLTANVTRNWRLQVNYSKTNSVTSNVAPEIQVWASAELPYYKKFDQTMLVATGLTIAQEIARWEAANVSNKSVEGLATTGNRSEKLSVVARYSFNEGRLKGFYSGATARHQGKNVVGATTAFKVLYGNSVTRADAFVGYNFGRLSRIEFLKNLTLQLNVYNVFNQHDPLLIRYADDNAANLTPKVLIPQEPRYWRLTANLAF